MKLFLATTLFVFFYTDCICQVSKIDTLKNELAKANNNKEKIEVLYKLSRVQMENTATDAEVNARQGLILSKKEKLGNNTAAFYLLLARYYEKKGEFDIAILYADSAAVHIENNKEGTIKKISQENQLGNLYRCKAKYEVAMEHLKKAESLAENIDDIKVKFATLNLLGICNVSIKNYDQAKVYHKKAIALATQTGQYGYISKSNTNIGIIFRELNQFDSANIYFEESLKYAIKSGDSSAIVLAYDENGNVKTQLKDYKTARAYLTISLNMKLRLKEYNTLPYTYFYLASLEGEEKNIEAGKAWIKKALDLATEMKSNKQILDSYNSYHYFYMDVGMYDSALANYKIYKQLDAETNNENVKTKIEELNIKYETQKKDVEIKQQKLKLSYYFAGLISLISLLILSYALYNRKKLKLKLQMQQAITEEQVKANSGIIKAEETERQRISRDLHDNMGAYTNALLTNIQNVKTQSINKNSFDIMQSNAEMILSSLRETIWILNNKETTAQEFSDNFKDYCFKILRNYENINLETEEKFSVNKSILAKTAIHLNKIMQEIVQNILKHSNATQITYTTFCDENIFSISIEDNGTGYDTELIKKGNGLYNIKWRAGEANINYEIQSVINKGTEITIVVSV